MGAAEAEHHTSAKIILEPAGRKQHLFVIPNPADVVLQVGVLSDVVEAGRHWHVNHRTRLGGKAGNRSLKPRNFTDWAVLLEVSPPTNSLTNPLASGNSWENLFRNWCGLSQVLFKSYLISGPGTCLFLQQEAAPIFFLLRILVLLMALVLRNQKSKGGEKIDAPGHCFSRGLPTTCGFSHPALATS